MKSLFRTEPKVFNLLSIGQRGAGKTVFLAGSYAELHSQHQKDEAQSLWFDCQDAQAQANMDSVLNYVARTGQYPPATMKITNFNFTLKRRRLREVQTLSHFRWWDIPGESCNIYNPEFRSIVFNSHGCCILIDAYELARQSADQQALEDIIQSAASIAELVYLNSLWYPFAVILTKCDQLESGSLGQEHLKEGLRRINAFLSGKAPYKLFYSQIPIVSTEEDFVLQAEGAAVSLLWLVSKLSKTNSFGLISNLVMFVAQSLPSRSQQGQSGF